jgi:hypothetical protein
MLKGFEENMMRVSDLLQLTRAARSEVGKRTTRPIPKSRARFQVFILGEGRYEVAEAETGAVRHTLSTYKEAMNYLQCLESSADQRRTQ